MSTPNEFRSAPGMGTPTEAPLEMDDAEDRTSRVDAEGEGFSSHVDAALPVELPPLPVETTPGRLKLVPRSPTITSPLGNPLAAPPADELIGRRCGGYVIEALLGEGGMGKVYLATNPRMGKRAAVKVILPEHSKSPQTVDRFLQEAKAAAQLDDPNIIDLLDASELDDGRAYLLMPFVEGTSLEELCERQVPLPLETVASILIQICSGLDAAHQHGIIHRDVKPQNILVGPRQQREHFVRIVDFGIAKLLDPHLAGKYKTQTMALMGTPGYMAPEQAGGGRNIDARADVYAVAVVAYRMLTGRRPYLEEALFALIEAQVSNAPFPRPRELRPDIPVEWDEAIMAGLAGKPQKRLRSVREFALRLASGLPEGEQMLRALAPRLADSKLPPTAPTLAPFLDQDLAQRVGGEPRQSERRRGGFAVWQVALLGCALLVIGTLLGRLGVSEEPSSPSMGSIARSSSPPAPARTASGEEAAAAVAPSEGDPAAVAPRAEGGPEAAGAKPPPATSSSTSVSAPASISASASVSAPPATSPPAQAAPAGLTAPAAAPATASATEMPSKSQAASPTQPAESRPRTSASSAAKATRGASAAEPPAGAKPPDGSGGGGKTDDADLSREELARLAKLGAGLLIVNAKPWAQISINGKLDGYTPKRKELPAGRYTVRMTKDDRNIDVVVTVRSGKVSTIDRSFR